MPYFSEIEFFQDFICPRNRIHFEKSGHVPFEHVCRQWQLQSSREDIIKSATSACVFVAGKNFYFGRTYLFMKKKMYISLS